MGWIGLVTDCKDALDAAGADQDENGSFLVYCVPPSRYMGFGDEIVVPDATEYSVNGRRFGLAEMLWHSKKGVRVNVL